MDVKFRAMTAMRTINAKVPRERGGTETASVLGFGCGFLAPLFFTVSIYSLLRTDDIDALLYLGLTLLCIGGVLLRRRLLHHGALALGSCVLLTLLAGCAAIWGQNTILTSMLTLFLPILFINLCGIKYGFLLGAGLTLFYAVLFYSPLVERIPAEYPEQLQFFCPLILAAVCLIYFVRSYFRQKYLLGKQDNEATLEKAVTAEHQKLMAMTTQTILSISNAVDARDTYTQRHSARVAEYSVLLAQTLGWDSARLEQLHSIALLHDIGKLGVSDSILNKHANLNDEEYLAIQQHTVIGGEILKDLTLLPNASIGAVSHHERFDGTGYPYGLKGAQIPIEARIIGIADAFDAMNSSRVYRARMAPGQILQELEKGSGTQFDPELLSRFLPIAEQLLKADLE